MALIPCCGKGQPHRSTFSNYLSWVSSAVSFISYFAMSIHLVFWRPRFWYPFTYVFAILLTQLFSSLHSTCLYQHNLASQTLSVMLATPTAVRMSLFFFLSFSETPNIHHRISVLSNSSLSCSSVTLTISLLGIVPKHVMVKFCEIVWQVVTLKDFNLLWPIT